MTKDHLLTAYLILIAIMFIIIGYIIGSNTQKDTGLYEQPFIMLEAQNASLFVENKTFGVVSAYNSFENQTDSTPCIGAGGYICGRNDVVANNCLDLGTIIEIDGKFYEVQDRMNKRYGCDHYDIFMDKDLQKAKEFGRQELEVIIY